MTKRMLQLAAVAACLAAVTPASAQPKPAAVDVVTLPGVGTASILSYQVRFVSADPATRRVVLETPSGERWAVIAPPLVGDLSYFRVGQNLLIRKLPGVVTAVGKPAKGKAGDVEDEVVVDAGLPGLPEGFGVREVSVVAPVVSVDPANATVSFPGPDGYLRTLKASNGEVLANLQKLTPGTVAKITYVEGLAINAVQ